MENQNEFKIVAKTFGGLEDILAKELEDLGANKVTPLNRAVEFFGNKRMLYLANLKCRTALKILKPVYEFEASDAEQVYHKLRHFSWSDYLTVDNTFAIQSVVNSENFMHSKFVAYKVKDALVDYFNKEFDKRPSVSVSNPDVSFNIHISGTKCTFSVDSSGESLHKRGWRMEQTEAPLNEVLAAGLLLRAGWNGQCDLYDPMCGSGTLLIEAAMIATNTPPGLYRQEFAFEKWSDFDRDLLDDLYNDDSGEKEFKFKIYGSDVSRIATDKSIENIKNAGMSKFIETETLTFQSLEPKSTKGIIITNPPYGERLKVSDLQALYGLIGERLKHRFMGFEAWIFGYQEDSFHAIGLRPSAKYYLKNGPLDCQLRQYELYEGSKKTGKPYDKEPRRDDKFGNTENKFKPRSEKTGDFKRSGDSGSRPFNREKSSESSDRGFKPRGEKSGDFKRGGNSGSRPFNREKSSESSDRGFKPRGGKPGERTNDFKRGGDRNESRPFNRDRKPGTTDEGKKKHERHTLKQNRRPRSN